MNLLISALKSSYMLDFLSVPFVHPFMQSLLIVVFQESNDM